jgi:hypothetical protein
MRWTITEFDVDSNGGLARPFHFELIANTVVDSDKGILRGDGLLFSDGRVRFNREDSVRTFASGCGLDERRFLSELGSAISEEAGIGKNKGRAAVA